MIQDKWDRLLAEVKSRRIKECDVKIDSSSGEITIEDSRFKLSVVINEKWIGYSFLLKKHLLGTEMSSWADTDNYAPDFNPKVTEEIYSEVKTFVANLQNLLNLAQNQGRLIFILIFF